MGETRLQRDARRRSEELRRGVGEAIRRLREDAGLTKTAVAVAAGIDPSYLTLIEAGRREAGYEVVAAVGAVLGADLSVRLFPNTGPRIPDRIQAAMGEALLPTLHPRWTTPSEVPVFRPARGVIDIVLSDRTPTIVAGELQSEMRRLEQQIRWHREKEASLPSAELWRFIAADREPATSRLLVLRSTSTMRDLATTYEATLHAAYAARAADILAALQTAAAPWPGPGIIWVRVDGGVGRLMDGPPRGVGLGR